MSELRAFDRSLPMALMRAREAVMQQFRPTLSAHGLSEQQWRILRALTVSDTPRSVGQLAETTYLLGPSMSRMLVSLEQRGLISRTIDHTDGRRSAIVATADGRALVDTIAPISESRYRWIEQAVGRDELEHLYQLLDHVAALGDVALASGDTAEHFRTG